MTYNLVGQKFGRLTVLSHVPQKHTSTKAKYYLCRCDCGNTAIVRGTHLTSGKIVSCKCYQKERQIQAATSHGMSKQRIYRIYRNMLNRCYYPKHPEFKYWGGRGIKVCDEWREDFLNFYNWALSNGYENNLSIDRIDVDGNYTPLNCRWATPKEQVHNRREANL